MVVKISFHQFEGDVKTGGSSGNQSAFTFPEPPSPDPHSSKKSKRLD